MIGKKVKTINDFLTGKTKDVASGEVSALDLPSSNVLQYILEDDTYVTARPSGTEPKIKFYFGVNDKTEAGVDKKLADTMEQFLAQVL